MEFPTMPIDENPSEWPRNDNRRLLRAIIKVGDLQQCIKFYTEGLGMTVLRRADCSEKEYSIAVLGFGPEESSFVIEMRYFYGVDKYEIGTGFGDFAIATQDVFGTVEKVRAIGGIVTIEPVVLPGRPVFAFLLDPNGYEIEIIGRPPTPEQICQISFRVADMDRAIEFYQKALGLNVLLPKIDVIEMKYSLAMLGYGTDLTQTTVVEFKSDFIPTDYTKGNSYQQLIIGTNDVYKTSEALEIVTRELGGKITNPPGPIPDLNIKIVAFVDPEGWEMVFVDNEDYLRELQNTA